jgi:carbamoyltransferase
MISWGVSAGFHDAALTIVQDGVIVFASHSERYSRIKNDKNLNWGLLRAALEFGKPDIIFWYENPLLKATRRIWAGQKNWYKNPRSYFTDVGYNPECPIEWGNHHKSHFAAGYYTSPFVSSATLVIDAIGEWTTSSIWKNDKKVWSSHYPKSLGLFYTAFTDRLGLKPNEDEYILMGMSAYGNPDRFFAEISKLTHTVKNMHKGVRNWRPELTSQQDLFDIAAAVQKVFESYLHGLLNKTKELTGEKNLVYMGGCALNCLANRLIPEYFKSHWIMPNPGDAGSSLGAILAHTKEKVNFCTPYLGHQIKGEYPVDKALQELLHCGIVGIANGKAEFGPRALGNRSLLADPRGKEMQDKVNAIKQRQEFRPFAPVIRKEDAKDYFDVDETFNSPYMQQVVKCKYPDKYPAIVHKDGTSRIQTVTYNQNKGLYLLLTAWYEETGCPMLLNTSLNIKGQPVVNTVTDGQIFSKHYKVKVM